MIGHARFFSVRQLLEIDMLVLNNLGELSNSLKS